MFSIRNRAATVRSSRTQKYRPVAESLESRTLLAVGTWTPLVNAAPDTTGIGTMMLLSDGTVMAQGGGSSDVSSAWYKLTPDSSGGYVNGTWSQLASMSTERLYYASNVLQDGRVFVQGGEYSGPSGAQNLNNTGEIYDPVANTWTTIATFPNASFGDDPTQLLPDGRVLAGYIFGPETYIYDPSTNAWSPAATKLDGVRSDEEGWIKLPDDSILTYDVFDNGHAQRYIPSQNQWVSTGPVPVDLAGTLSELGPGFLLPDGRAFYIGETGHTAYYTPSSDTWAAGPDLPNGLMDDDAPGAMMPDGDILIAADFGNFSGPTTIFDFNPVTGVYTDVTPTVLDGSGPCYIDRMLMLPTGQVLTANSSNQLAVYTPGGSADPAWKPHVDQISANADGSFTITGTQLNGISQGAAYGDDAEMDTNYPIVELVNSSNGQVSYARSYNWSSTGVATGSTPVTTLFQAPGGLTQGSYSLIVIANGIASDPFIFNAAGLTTTTVTSAPDPLYYGQSVTLTATVDAVSGAYTPQGTVQFTINGSNYGAPVTLVSGKASVVDASLSAGSYKIKAIFAATDGISNGSIGTLAGGLSVLRAPLIVKADNASKTYGQAFTFAGTEYAIGSPLYNGDSVSSITLTSAGAAATAKVAGSPYSIIPSNATGSGLSNYSIAYVSGKLTINPAALTISPHDEIKTYGRPFTFLPTDFDTDITLYNGDTVVSVTLSSPGAPATAPVAGSPYPITGSAAIGTGLGNYAITYASGQLTVNPAALTIAARNQSKIYGQVLPSLGTEFIPGSLFNGDTITSVMFSSPGAAATATAAGSPYPIIPSAATGTGVSNYVITYKPGTLMVNRAALAITADNLTKAYGQSLTFTGTEFSTSTLYNNDSVSNVIFFSPGAPASAPASDSAYAITPGSAAGVGLANYSITYNGGSLTVTPAVLLITAANETKSYGQALSFAGTEFTTSALYNSDTVASVVLSSPGAATGAAITTGSPYPITPSAASGFGIGNYVITYADGGLTVTRAALTITARNESKNYGTALSFAGTEFTTGPLYNGDTITSVTLSSPGTTAASTVAASPYAITPSAALGTGNGNYVITYAIGSLTVNPAPLTITAGNQSKTYGQFFTLAGNNFTASALYNGDAVTSVSLSSPGTASAATVAGSPYSIVPAAASGSGLGNYAITYTNGSFTVNQAPLTITAGNASKPYGQIIAFAGTEFTTTGSLYNGDTIIGAILTSAGTAAAATVTSSPYSVIPSNAFGSGVGNYAITYNDGSFTVNQAALTITAGSQSKTYGQSFTFAGNEFTTSSLYNGDTVTSVSLTSPAAAAAAAVTGSPYSIVPAAASGSGLGNYSITYHDGGFTVKPAALTITAGNEVKPYGQTLSLAGTEFTASGLLNGDTVTSVTFSSPGATASAAIAGSPYPIVPANASGPGVSNYVITYNGGSLTVTLPLVDVTGIRTVTNKNHRVTQILVTLSGAVNTTQAAALGTYQLKAAGKHNSFTARNSKTIKLRSAAYNVSANVVTLRPKKPFALSKPVQLQINGTPPAGLQDSLGRLLDGDNNGQAGGNTVAILRALSKRKPGR